MTPTMPVRPPSDRREPYPSAHSTTSASMYSPQHHPVTYGQRRTPRRRLDLTRLGHMVAEPAPSPSIDAAPALDTSHRGRTHTAAQTRFAMVWHTVALLVEYPLNACVLLPWNTQRKLQSNGRHAGPRNFNEEQRTAFCEAYTKSWLPCLDTGALEVLLPHAAIPIPPEHDHGAPHV